MQKWWDRLLADLDGLRRSTRGRRHAYWFPLVLFGLLLCGAAPLFVRMAAPCEGSCYVATAGPFWLRGFGDGALGVYWLCAPARRDRADHAVVRLVRPGRRVADAGRRSLARRLPGTVLLLAAATVAASASALLWPAIFPQDAALLVVAAGLLVLARLERSGYLLVVAVVVAGLAVLATYDNPENLLFRLLHLCGVADAALPFRSAGALGVLLPGVVLLAVGVAALAGDARRR